MKNFNEYIIEQTDNTTIYQIGRSKKNIVKIIKLNDTIYQLIYTENGGQYNFKGDLNYVMNQISTMIKVGGASNKEALSKLKLVSGIDILAEFK